MSDREDKAEDGDAVARLRPITATGELTRATGVPWTEPDRQTFHAGGKVLFRFSPQWTIDYIDPDLLASLKEWLRDDTAGAR